MADKWTIWKETDPVDGCGVISVGLNVKGPDTEETEVCRVATSERLIAALEKIVRMDNSPTSSTNNPATVARAALQEAQRG